MVTKGYFILAKDREGFTYYYHSDGKFHTIFLSIGGTYFKTWQRKGCAINAFNRMRTNDKLVSISLMCCEVGKDIRTESTIIGKK